MPKLRANSQTIEKVCTDCLMSIKFSLDAYYKEEDSKEVEELGITKEQNFLTTIIITKGQVKTTAKILDSINRSCFRLKHSAFRSALIHFDMFIDTFADDLQGNDPEQLRFAKGLVDWIKTAHVLLLEDTRRKDREHQLELAKEWDGND